MARPSALIGVLALVILTSPLVALSQQALVTTQSSAALEIGQAFLTHFGQQCYAIMPTHVLAEAAGKPALLREGRSHLLGETVRAADLKEDVSIVTITGAISNDCGLGALTIQRSIERLLQQGRLAALRSVNGDGSIAQLVVAIVDDDGKGFLRIQPTHQGNPIRKGMSGSLLMIDGVITGMLLSVNARNGIGTVARIDQIMSKADTFLMSASTPAGQTQANVAPASAGSGDTKHLGTGGLRILTWSDLPLDDAHRAANLIATDDSAPWASKPTRWPFSIDMQLGDTVSTVSTITLDGRGVTNPGALPARIEVFMNLSTESRDWRSVVSEPLSYSGGVAEIRLAPTRARLLRLKFFGAVDGGAVISLGRVRFK